MLKMLVCELISCITAVLLCALPVGAQAPKYDQPYRPQVHFSPQKNWTNDPNGLVYFRGEYHLFFQYNPFGDQWGHMSWGHAVSTDLLHWHELPVAIPEQDGIMIFTGSVVVDRENTSGFCAAEERMSRRDLHGQRRYASRAAPDAEPRLQPRQRAHLDASISATQCSICILPTSAIQA